MKFYCKMILFCCCLPALSWAEIITDGSLGNAIRLTGTNFQITADLGQQFGNNLFHSFEKFNLSANEIATFSGLGSIQNIISRVTGGTVSQLDGTIRSEIPNANLYLINPKGILFGKDAQLDVSGGFYASTADVLRFSDGGEFHTDLTHSSLLTAAPIHAFGFLTDSPAAISIQNSQFNTPHLSLIGGNLNLNGANLHSDEIRLASVAQKGFVTDTIDLNLPQGKIYLTDSMLDTSGEGGGQIWIRGGQLLMQHSTLRSDTQGQLDGLGINVATSENIHISGDQMAISSVTSGQGNSGTIELNTPDLTIQGSVIESSSLSSGHAGNIQINTQRTQLTQGAAMISDTFAAGAGGNIALTATQSLKMSGRREGEIMTSVRSLGLNNPTWLGTNTFSSQNAGNIAIHAGNIDLTTAVINSMSLSSGNSGNIEVYGHDLQLMDGGLIDCLGLYEGGTGSIIAQMSGDIEVIGHYPGDLVFAEGFVIPNTESGLNSVTFGVKNAGNIDIRARNLTVNGAAINASTLSDGNAGLVSVHAEGIYLEHGGQINSTSGLILDGEVLVGNGNGGSLYMNASKEIVIRDREDGFNSGFFTATQSSIGNSGNIELRTPKLSIIATSGIGTQSSGASNSGYVKIYSDEVILSKGGKIGTEAQSALEGGGVIDLNVSRILYLDHGEINTSITSGNGSGGDIGIVKPQFVVLNQSSIRAQAEGGHGGNIHIVADNFIRSSESLISASSRLGINGNILIRSPGETVSSSILSLSNKFLDASHLFPQSCRAKTDGQRPSEFIRPFTFTINLFNRFPTSPGDLVPSLSKRLH
jgi:filamentous hemagglutinin family protein